MNANNGLPILNTPTSMNIPNQPSPDFSSIDLSNPHRAQPFLLTETDSEQIQFDNTEQLSAGTAISRFITSPSQQLVEFPKFGKNLFSNLNNDFGNSDNENVSTLYIDHNGIFKVRYGSSENNNDNIIINGNDDHDHEQPLDNIINNNNDAITFDERIFTLNNDDDDNINDKDNKSINDETKTATTSSLNNKHTFYDGLPVFT